MNPDPGSPRSARIALVLAVVLTAVAVGLQNIPPLIDLVERFTGGAPTAPTETEPPAESDAVLPPDFSRPFDIMSKLYVKLDDAVRGDPSAMPTLDQFAVDDADRIRAAVVAAEILGPEEAITRLDTIIPDLADAPLLLADAKVFKRIFAGEPPEEADPARQTLVNHHGFFAEVALTFELPDDHPLRIDLVRGGVLLAGVLLAAGAVVTLAFVAGCVLLVVWIVMMFSGKTKATFKPPAPGGSVMLEVFCWFVGGFLIVSLGSDVIARAVYSSDPTATWPGMIPLVAQWLLLLAPLWPLVRGASKADLAKLVGWNTGKGLFREIGFGLLAYLAGLPVFFAAVVATLGLITIVDVLAGVAQGPPPSPVIDLVAGGSPLALVLVFVLATIWAPLCEELVFRGALQRHVRARLAGPLAIVVTATVFGFMHGYGPLLVLPLIALGSVFGAIRELRGSIVPSITAHFLHNATVLTLVITVVTLVG